MKELKDRLKLARKNAGLTQSELADRAGIKQSSVSEIERGLSRSSIHLIKLAQICNVDPVWLSEGAGRARHHAEDMAAISDKKHAALANRALDSMSNVEMALQPTRSFSYPEISWVQAGSATEAIELSNIAACPRHTSDVWAGENGFWLRVVGASMTSPAGGNSFPEGFLILIAPDTEPHYGQYVVARMIDTNEATFKQLVRDAGEMYLKPLNPSFPMKAVDDAWEIVGTVVDGKMPKSVFF